MKGFPCSMLWKIQSHFHGGHRKGQCLILNIVAFICCVDVIIKGLAVNGQAVNPVGTRTSSRGIIAKKGSSLWLHWNYTYIGDGLIGSTTNFTYREHIIELYSKQRNIETLARRNGKNGALTLEKPVPAPFNGRVEMISSNSTLVIHNLQYNDSTYQILSDAIVDSAKAKKYNLRPVVSIKVNGATYQFSSTELGGVLNGNLVFKPEVSITVNGIPDFIARPPLILDVNEGLNLKLQVTMDGNPQPSADFRWPHLTGSSPTNVPSVQLYPFVYSSTYTLNKIDASYCGRILQTTLKNSIGSTSVTASTSVTVLLKLDMDFGLKAGKIRRPECVEVKFNKVEAGACYVKYTVVLKTALGSSRYKTTVYNIGETTMCGRLTLLNITNVQLTVSFKSTSRTIITKISDTPLTTPTPTTPETTRLLVSQNATTSLSSPNAKVLRHLSASATTKESSSGLAVNGQIVSPVEVNSSSSHVITIKGSSVWLHWNYTYIGDGVHGPLAVTYKEQIIGFNTTLQPTIQTLAKRTGQYGALTLESPVPAPYNRRVEVMSANNTFVIHGLQYNDSAYQLSSFDSVDVDAGFGAVPNIIVLKPVVSITVNGIPDFIVRPPITLDVNEGSNLQLQVTMDGNPQPSADFRWPHLTGSSPTNVPSVQFYPFVYSSTYTLNKIDASYCGRILQTTVKNDIGSSSETVSTNVSGLLK